MIRYLCAYCQIEIRPPEDLAENTDLVSHGICRSCLGDAMSKYGRSLSDFLNGFREPVLVVDQGGRIITVNGSGQEMLAKEIDQIEGYLGGEVFGCFHAKETGTCGEAIHCLSCVIRNTVEETYRTGVAHQNITACQDLDTVSGPRPARFSISTEKVDDSVVLKIEEVNYEQF